MTGTAGIVTVIAGTVAVIVVAGTAGVVVTRAMTVAAAVIAGAMAVIVVAGTTGVVVTRAGREFCVLCDLSLRLPVVLD